MVTNEDSEMLDRARCLRAESFASSEICLIVIDFCKLSLQANLNEIHSEEQVDGREKQLIQVGS